jgi:hypothetical protein
MSEEEERSRLIDWAEHKLHRCVQRQFYGKVTFLLECGRIVRSVTEESEMPGSPSVVDD